jgi:hypothetical protein
MCQNYHYLTVYEMKFFEKARGCQTLRCCSTAHMQEVTCASSTAGSGCASRVARDKLGAVVFRRQGDGMKTLDAAAGDSVME